MGKNSIPDRWLNYKAIGNQIRGTNFIAFKVPLNDHANKSVRQIDQFSGGQLLDKIPNLGLIIDLTNTNRYYNPDEFKKKGIQYAKVMVPGHEVPKTHIREQFLNLVKKFLKEKNNSNKLIGVHCTHGINRTGFLICYFMILELNIDPLEAIKRFEIARGYAIERKNYLNFLTTFKDSSVEEFIEKKSDETFSHKNNESSTFKNNYFDAEEYAIINHYGNIEKRYDVDYFEDSHQRKNLNSLDLSASNQTKWNEDTNSVRSKNSFRDKYRPRAVNSFDKKSRNFRTNLRPYELKSFQLDKKQSDKFNDWRETRRRDANFQNITAITKTRSFHHSNEKKYPDYLSWRNRQEEPRQTNFQHDSVTKREKSPLYHHNLYRETTYDKNCDEMRQKTNFGYYETNPYRNNEGVGSERFYTNYTLSNFTSQSNRNPTPQQQYLNTFDKTQLKHHASSNHSRNRNQFRFD